MFQTTNHQEQANCLLQLDRKIWRRAGHRGILPQMKFYRAMKQVDHRVQMDNSNIWLKMDETGDYWISDFPQMLFSLVNS